VGLPRPALSSAHRARVADDIDGEDRGDAVGGSHSSGTSSFALSIAWQARASRFHVRWIGPPRRLVDVGAKPRLSQTRRCLLSRPGEGDIYLAIVASRGHRLRQTPIEELSSHWQILMNRRISAALGQKLCYGLRRSFSFRDWKAVSPRLPSAVPWTMLGARVCRRARLCQSKSL
jgi:hypothetical protein